MKPSSITNCSPFSRYRNIQLCLFQGRKVILKNVEKKNRFDHEKRMYELLQSSGSVRGLARLIASYDQTLVVEYIEAKNIPTDVAVKVQATEQLLKTVKRMHEKGIVHKDLRFGDNVIFDGSRFVIIDFDVACARNEICDSGAASSYAEFLFDEDGKTRLSWNQWVFLDYLHLVDEFSILFEGHEIGRRFYNMRLNAMDLSGELLDEESTSFGGLLNAKVILEALHGDTDLTTEYKDDEQPPFPAPPSLDGLDKEALVKIMNSYAQLWEGVYKEDFAKIPNNLSTEAIKRRIEYMSNEEAMLLYYGSGDIGEDDFIDGWSEINLTV